MARRVGRGRRHGLIALAVAVTLGSIAAGCTPSDPRNDDSDVFGPASTPQANLVVTTPRGSDSR